MAGVLIKFLRNGSSLKIFMLLIVFCVILKIGHDGMEINHMDLIVVIGFFLEALCKCKLQMFLEKLLRLCLRPDNNFS